MQYPISALDGRYAKAIQPLSRIMSEYGLMQYRVRVMIAWLDFLAHEKIMPHGELVSALRDNAGELASEHYERIKELEAETRHDVKAVEYFLREQSDQKLWPWIHICCTSEDVNNVAYALMLRDARCVTSEVVEAILKQLEVFAMKLKANAMLSRTHGQAATPTTMGKELAVFYRRLDALHADFNETVIEAKFNGATGNFAAHHAAFPEHDWTQLSEKFIERQVGLAHNPLTTQIESHDVQAAMMNAVSQISIMLTDLCSDLWLYISQDYFSQKVVAGEVGSSTMPHKVNPIDLENARGNFWIANGLARTLAERLPVSTLQRDLSDSTLQRTFGTVFGHFLVGLKSLQRGLGKLELRPEVLQADLEANPEVLTEAIQTVLRKHGHADAYEQLKNLSRGQKIDLAQIREFVRGLDIPTEDKERLLALTPSTYIGLSVELVDNYF